jgi:hypothetical protein
MVDRRIEGRGDEIEGVGCWIVKRPQQDSRRRCRFEMIEIQRRIQHQIQFQFRDSTPDPNVIRDPIPRANSSANSKKSQNTHTNEMRWHEIKFQNRFDFRFQVDELMRGRVDGDDGDSKIRFFDSRIQFGFQDSILIPGFNSNPMRF